jgi:hypothetical protein
VIPLALAIAWVHAGGKAGPEREALVRSLHGPTLAAGVGEWVTPNGLGADQAAALALWKAAAKRALKGRGSAGAKPAERVPATVWVTLGMRAKLDRGETVTITGATLVEVCDG